MKNSLLLIPLLLLSACSTTNSYFSKPDLSKIQVGMTKSEVVAKLGKPDDLAMQGRLEYLEYGYDSPLDGKIGRAETYVVRLLDGRVDLYGRKGDFGTTANPGLDVNIRQDINSKSVVSVKESSDNLYLKLKNLQQLRDDKVITEEEFKKLKNEAISKSN